MLYKKFNTQITQCVLQFKNKVSDIRGSFILRTTDLVTVPDPTVERGYNNDLFTNESNF